MRREPTGYLVQPQRTVRRGADERLLDWLMQPHAEHIPVTLEDILRRPEWHREAACRGLGASGFVKSTGGAYGATRREAPAARCARECLDFALADEVDRRLVGRDERRRAARATPAGGCLTEAPWALPGGPPAGRGPGGRGPGNRPHLRSSHACGLRPEPGPFSNPEVRTIWVVARAVTACQVAGGAMTAAD